MEESYDRFASHITELKMEHRDGKLASDRLTQLLGYDICDIVIIQYIIINAPWMFIYLIYIFSRPEIDELHTLYQSTL